MADNQHGWGHVEWGVLPPPTAVPPRVHQLAPGPRYYLQVIFTNAMSANTALVAPASYLLTSGLEEPTIEDITILSPYIVQLTVADMYRWQIFHVEVLSDNIVDILGYSIPEAYRTAMGVFTSGASANVTITNLFPADGSVDVEASAELGCDIITTGASGDVRVGATTTLRRYEDLTPFLIDTYISTQGATTKLKHRLTSDEADTQSMTAMVYAELV